MTPSSVVAASHAVNSAATTTIAGPAIRNHGQRWRYQGSASKRCIAGRIRVIEDTLTPASPRKEELGWLAPRDACVVHSLDDDFDLARQVALLPRFPLMLFVDATDRLGRRLQD